MPEEDRAISNVLCELDYCGYRLNNRKWVRKPGAIHLEEDGVWGTVLLVPAERHACVAALIGTERSAHEARDRVRSFGGYNNCIAQREHEPIGVQDDAHLIGKRRAAAVERRDDPCAS